MTSNLVSQIEAWLASEKGQRYSCARHYAREFDPNCEGCLLMAAVRDLKAPPALTPPTINERVSGLLRAMIDNDPNALAADNGGTLLDLWRYEAESILRGSQVETSGELAALWHQLADDVNSGRWNGLRNELADWLRAKGREESALKAKVKPGCEFVPSIEIGDDQSYYAPGFDQASDKHERTVQCQCGGKWLVSSVYHWHLDGICHNPDKCRPLNGNGDGNA